MFPFLFTGDPESRVGIRVHSNRNGPINNAQGPFTDHTENSTTSGRTQFHHLFKIFTLFFGGTSFDISFGVQSQSGQPYIRSWRSRTWYTFLKIHLLAANMAAEPFSSKYLRASIGGARNRDPSCYHYLTVWDQAENFIIFLFMWRRTKGLYKMLRCFNLRIINGQRPHLGLIFFYFMPFSDKMANLL